MFGLDLQAIAVDVDDSDAIARRGGAASCRPFAVAYTNTPAVRIDGLDHDHDLAEQPGNAVIEQGIAAMVVA